MVLGSGRRCAIADGILRSSEVSPETVASDLGAPVLLGNVGGTNRVRRRPCLDVKAGAARVRSWVLARGSMSVTPYTYS